MVSATWFYEVRPASDPPREFAEAGAGVPRHTRAEYNVRPDVTPAREASTLLGDEPTCAPKVDDGPKLRHRQWQSEVRRRVAAGGAPSPRLSLKPVKAKWYRRGNKVKLRLKPMTTPDINTYSKYTRRRGSLSRWPTP